MFFFHSQQWPTCCLGKVIGKQKIERVPAEKQERQSYHIKDNGKVSIEYDIYEQGLPFNIL